MNFPLFLAKRYAFSKRGIFFSFFTSLLSIFGICIGVSALLITLSIMNGFHEDLREKILGTYSHIIVFLKENLKEDEIDKIERNLRKINGVVATSRYILKEALLKSYSFSQGCVVKGIEDSALKVGSISDFVKGVNISELKEGEAVIGSELAINLGVGIGDEVYLIVAEDYFITPSVYKFKIRGIFQSGMYEYDRTLFYIKIQEAKRIFGKSITGIEVKTESIYDVDRIKKEIYKKFPNSYVKTWKEINQNLYRALKLEKTVMFIVLTLIILVATFNIISSLVFLTIKKTKEIGLLKALGMVEKDIFKSFLYQGLIKGMIGIISGNLISILILELLKKYKFIHLPQSVYYLNYLPINIRITDFILVDIVALILSLFATYFPARRASKIEPAMSLRYE